MDTDELADPDPDRLLRLANQELRTLAAYHDSGLMKAEWFHARSTFAQALISLAVAWRER